MAVKNVYHNEFSKSKNDNWKSWDTIEDSVVIRLQWILTVDHKKCLYKSFFGLSSMKLQRSALLRPLWRQSTSYWWIPLTKGLVT